MMATILKDSSMRLWRSWAILAPRTSLALAACLWAGLPAHASPSRVIILGDSIGVGLSLAGGSQRLATNSVAIRSTEIMEQLRRVDASQVAVVSLGTNDAVGHLKGVEKAIDQIVDQVNRSNLRVIWMGPPCVNKAWNTNVLQLDRILQERLRRAPRITYVSVADQNYCDRTLRAGDGVHFTMKGYGLLWAHVKDKSGIKIDEPAIARPKAAPTYTSAKSYKKKRRKISTQGSASLSAGRPL
jgi:lysophospholipase L1-like esterase